MKWLIPLDSTYIGWTLRPVGVLPFLVIPQWAPSITMCSSSFFIILLLILYFGFFLSITHKHLFLSFAVLLILAVLWNPTVYVSDVYVGTMWMKALYSFIFNVFVISLPFHIVFLSLPNVFNTEVIRFFRSLIDPGKPFSIKKKIFLIFQLLIRSFLVMILPQLVIIFKLLKYV